MAKDPWRTLGLSRKASLGEARRAFRRLAWELHPDRRPGDRAAEERFKEAVEALAAVTAESTERRPATRSPAGRARSRALDIVADFEVTLGEAVRGGEHGLRLRTRVPCATCRGVRSRPTTCPTCRGQGTQPVDRRVRLRLAAGIRDGDEVRLAGEGLATREGQGRGDLRVRLAVRVPAGVRIDGNDLHCDLPLTVPEACAGARLDLPTPRGRLVVAVPAGVLPGKALRVRGHGLPPRPGSVDEPGDLFLHVVVVPPDRRDAATASAVEQLRNGYTEDVRSHLAHMFD